MRIHTFENKDTLTPQHALAYLKEGNYRFLSNLKVNRDLLSLVNQYSDAQFPFAAILGCSDSRVPTELIFDQGLGDLFIVRLAGNIASKNAIGSLEFSCKYLGSKIVVVLGHSACGAVKAACDHIQDGNITELVSHITPALKKEKTILTERTSKNEAFLDKMIHHNIEYQIETILKDSDILYNLAIEEKILIVGAVYDLNTGKVEFMENIATHALQKMAATSAN